MSKYSPETTRAGIAIIGMAGRFPGAPSVAAFWRNLIGGVEAIRFATAEDLTAAGVDPRLAGHPDFVPASSTIDQPEYFDAGFFGFSAREAEIIDPQQRVLLECAWEALEDAGYDSAAYPGAIGVFAGAGMNTYGVVNLFSNPEIIESVGPYQIMVGNDKDFLSTRISYKLNLRGPAVGVQTACSTSLVAVQMAYESLLRGECAMALAGGVSIPLPQSAGYLYTPGMIFSRDGHCRAFDAAASGTVPGAGAGIVVLKPLEAALADGDNIYAVIKGAAINNDGAAKAGYSAPSVEGQAAVIRRSMQMAGFAPETVGYVEAHGTGTEVGDPIEVTALAQAFESLETRPGSCTLGAVKTNIGHLDAAAGVAGLIKTALTLEHRSIPPTLHYRSANPLIDFLKMPFAVNSSLTKYEQPAPFRAGVSSFGIGGTNAHVSLEEPPRGNSTAAVGSQLMVLSAKSASALASQAERLAMYLEENPAANLADIAYTLQVGRRAFTHRRVLVAGCAEDLKTSLRQPASAAQQMLRTANAPAEPAGVAFLFPGQGSQYGNMGRDLYRTVPVFRSTVDLCAKILEPHLGLDLRTVLYPQPEEEAEAELRLNQTALTQPALFVVEYAMAQLWMDCGIYPAAMIGHSVGEYVAACIAGVFSLEDALALIAARGRMVQSMPAGAMLAVQLSEQDLEPLLGPETSIAAVNAPGQTVASGPEPAIQALEAALAAKKIESRRLRTSHAFHSPMMDPIVESFIERVARVKLQAPRLRYLSNVTGTWITDRQATNPGYWGSHLRNAVRFADCGRTLLRDTRDALLEVGPGETLLSLLRRQMEKADTRPLIASMRHAQAKQNDRDAWLTAAGRLWLQNAPLNWKGLYREERRLRIPLPTYPFERQRYWIEPKKLQATAAPEAALGKKPEIADWFYLPSWKRSARQLLSASIMEQEDAWIVFAEDGELAAAIEKELSAGSRLIRVRPGKAFQEISSSLYEIVPGRREDYIQLLDGLAANNLWPRRIVHAWLPLAGSALELDGVLDRSIYSAMSLIQAIEERSSTRPVDLNIVADRAYSVLGEAISSPAAGALNAFGRVAALECPNITCRTIDLDLAANSGRALRLLIEELRVDAANEIVAYRGSARWTHFYEPVHIEAAAQKSGPALSLRHGGTYLITGGLGGVGLVLARHLARTAQANIVLTARTPMPAAAEWPRLLASAETPASLRQRIEGVQSIEAAGATVEVMAADSTDADAMREALVAIGSRFGSVNGVIHAAGIAGAGMLQTKSREQVMAVLAPKIQGSEWIREILPAKELDFVLLCSSISATIPSFGLSDYAAANAYLDGFAAMYDDPAGTRVLSANWDTWQEVGMAVEMALPGSMTHLLEGRLHHAIRSTEAEAVFDRLLQTAAPQVLISTRDFAALEQWTAREVVAFRDGLQRTASSSGAHGRPEALEDFVAAEDEIEQFIVHLWQELLGVEPIGIHDDFFKLGGHSLLGTQVLARIRERYRVDLSLRIIFEAATPAELAQHVRLLRWASNPVQAPSALEREEIEI